MAVYAGLYQDLLKHIFQVSSEESSTLVAVDEKIFPSDPRGSDTNAVPRVRESSSAGSGSGTHSSEGSSDRNPVGGRQTFQQLKEEDATPSDFEFLLSLPEHLKDSSFTLTVNEEYVVEGRVDLSGDARVSLPAGAILEGDIIVKLSLSGYDPITRRLEVSGENQMNLKISESELSSPGNLERISSTQAVTELSDPNTADIQPKLVCPMSFSRIGTEEAEGGFSTYEALLAHHSRAAAIFTAVSVDLANSSAGNLQVASLDSESDWFRYFNSMEALIATRDKYLVELGATLVNGSQQLSLFEGRTSEEEGPTKRLAEILGAGLTVWEMYQSADAQQEFDVEYSTYFPSLSERAKALILSLISQPDSAIREPNAIVAILAAGIKEDVVPLSRDLCTRARRIPTVTRERQLLTIGSEMLLVADDLIRIVFLQYLEEERLGMWRQAFELFKAAHEH